MKRLLILSLKFVFIFSADVFSEDCDHSLRILGNRSEDPEVYDRFVERVKVVQETAKQLGVNLPPHLLEIAPSHQLMALASLGRHAIRHWSDGMQLATAGWQAAGVLEFVTPGCPTCRSFYQASTPEDWQLSIFAHVVGHNDFGATSMWSTMRNADSISASLELNELVEAAYREHDHDEVSQFYQWISSFKNLQDLARHTFQAPESFVERSLKRTEHSKKRGSNPYGNGKTLKVSTPSVLQYLVQHLPDRTEPWKKDILQKFEEMNRVYGYYTSDKFMNEGWATYFQEIIIRHTPYTEDEHRFSYANLMAGVAGRPSISNPYWLGRESWRRIRARWDAEPENQGLRLFEADKKFIQFAHDEIINHMTDFDFLKYALDAQWVFDQNLYFHRAAEPHEQIQAPMPPGAEQRIVTSTNPDEIIFEIARMIGDWRFKAPRILLKDPDAYGRGVFRLVHEAVRDPSWSEDILGIPLQIPQTTLTLFLLSRVIKQPVSLETTVLEKAQTGMKSIPIRLEVNRSGDVAVFTFDENGIEKQDASSSEQLQKIIRMYEEDESVTFNSDLLESQASKPMQDLLSRVAQRAPQTSQSILSHAPTASGAMLEYYRLLKSRMLATMQKVFAGKLAAKKTSTGVKVPVMPIVPEIGFDRRALQAIISNETPDARINSGKSLVEIEGQAAYDSLPTYLAMGVDLGMGPKGSKGRKKKGDIFLGPSRDKGQGEGEGEEGEPGDDGEPGDPSNQPGEDGNDPREVEIPFAVYQEFLMQELELPYLKPKEEGEIFTDSEMLEGAIRKEAGEVLYERMMMDAMARGTMALKKKGIDPRSVPARSLLIEGMKHIYEDDHIVRDRIIIPQPNAKAVVLMMIDMSGSMMGWPMEATRKFVFNLKLALESKYEGVEFRFVGMDTKAHVYDNLEEFIKTDLGGGTDYSAGFTRSLEVFEDFPADAWDRYYFALGDSQDFRPDQALAGLDQILRSIEYTAYVHVDVSPSYQPEFRTQIENLLQSVEHAGFAVMREGPGTEFDALRQLFPKK